MAVSRLLTTFTAALLFSWACGGADTPDPATAEPTAAADPEEASQDDTTADDAPEEEPVDEEATEDGGTAGPTTTEDPAGDLVGAFDASEPCEDEASFDLALLTVTPSEEGFTVDITGHTSGDIQQIQVILTAPNGDYYDFRARSDGNHTADGGGPYAWDRLSEFQISLDGSADSYQMSVANIAPEPGWTVSVETRSACADVAEVTFG